MALMCSKLVAYWGHMRLTGAEAERFRCLEVHMRMAVVEMEGNLVAQTCVGVDAFTSQYGTLTAGGHVKAKRNSLAPPMRDLDVAMRHDNIGMVICAVRSLKTRLATGEIHATTTAAQVFAA